MDVSRHGDNYRCFVETFGGIAFRTKIGEYKPEFFHGSVEKITGYCEQDFINGNPLWTAIVHPDDRNLLEKEAVYIDTDPSYFKEKSYRIIHKNGEIRWVKEILKATPDEKGRPCYLNGTIFDVTASKALELNNLKNENFLENVFSAIQDGICVIDRNLKIIKVNSAMELFYPEHFPLTGKSSSEIFYTGSESEFWCPAQKSLEDGAVHEKVFPYYKSNEPNGWIQIFSFPIRDHSGDITGVIEHIKDVTGKIEAETDLKRSVIRLRRMLDGGISAIAKLVEKRDPYTSGHQQRVTELAVAIAKIMGKNTETIDCIRTASTIHDIGKMYVPAEILGKPTKLNELEFNLIREHPFAAFDVLREIDFPWPVADIVLQHHERKDGSGYPKGLKGNEICQEAQIIAVADSIEAMTSHRPYRPAKGLDKSLKELTLESADKLDSNVIESCIKLFLEEGFSFTTH